MRTTARPAEAVHGPSGPVRRLSGVVRESRTVLTRGGRMRSPALTGGPGRGYRARPRPRGEANDRYVALRPAACPAHRFDAHLRRVQHRRDLQDRRPDGTGHPGGRRLQRFARRPRRPGRGSGLRHVHRQSAVRHPARRADRPTGRRRRPRSARRRPRLRTDPAVQLQPQHRGADLRLHRHARRDPVRHDLLHRARQGWPAPGAVGGAQHRLRRRDLPVHRADVRPRQAPPRRRGRGPNENGSARPQNWLGRISWGYDISLKGGDRHPAGEPREPQPQEQPQQSQSQEPNAPGSSR